MAHIIDISDIGAGVRARRQDFPMRDSDVGLAAGRVAARPQKNAGQTFSLDSSLALAAYLGYYD